jgi:PAS domain S-box-containing protein
MNSPAITHFLTGGGEMGKLIRETDWSQTPLGPVENWSLSLKISLRIVLTSSQPMFVWWGDELINLYNDAYRSILGGKHPAALGAPASVVWREIWEQIGPRAATAMRSHTGTYDEALLLIMERNGYPEETYYTFSYSPIPDEQGKTAGIICANTDDTQRIIGERQLRTLKDLGKQLIDSKTNEDVYQATIQVLQQNPQDFPFAFFYAIDKDGSHATLSGATTILPEQLAPARLPLAANSPWQLAEAVHTGNTVLQDHLPAQYGALPAGAWQQSPEKALVVPVSQGAQTLPYAIMVVGLNPYQRADEKYTSFFRLVADQIANGISHVQAYEAERRRSQALLELDKAKTNFFSNISHEFRTPLTLMLGPLEELRSNEHHSLLSPAQQLNIESAHRNTLRLLRLVNNLLDFSRIEAGKTRACFAPVHLDELTQGLAGTFRAVIENAGLQFDVQCAPLNEEVYVDKEMWEKIVLNLLSNAFKYTLQGSIQVQLYQASGEAVLAITDTGVGIAENELTGIFERFHRVEQAAGRTQEGSGIGLALIKELVEMHKGKIEVRSTPGQGSCFTVKIPLGRAHLPAEQLVHPVTENPLPSSIIADMYINEALSLTGNGTTAGNWQAMQAIPGDDDNSHPHTERPSLLLVDDNADMRHYLQQLLCKQYEVTTAPHGKAALEAIAQRQPDLVISDVMMPVMNGIDLLHTLKNNSLTAKIPVILLSARAGEEAVVEGYNIGADDYLVKPFSAKELLARVQAQLRIVHIRRSTEKQLRNIFSQAPVAIAIFSGPSLVIEQANDAMLALWGKTTAILHQPVTTAFPETTPPLLEQLQQVYHSGRRGLYQEQPFMLQRNGSLQQVYISYVYEPLYDENGSITGVIAVANDVTDQVHARQQAEENGRYYQQLLNSLPVAVYTCDANGYITLYNEAAVDLWGRAPEPGKDLWCGSWRIFVPGTGENLPLDECPMAIVLKEQRFVEQGEIIIQRPDGERRHVLANPQPVFDKAGRMTGAINTLVDITPLKQVEQALRESEQRFRTMADTAPVMIWMAGPDKQANFFNKRWLDFTGRSLEEEWGNGWTRNVHPEDLNHCLHVYNSAFDAKQQFEIEYRLKRHDGEYRWILDHGTPILDAAGTLTAYIGSCMDIHERKTINDELEKRVTLRTHELQQANAALLQINEELEQFAYVSSHDLQEPLRKIQIFSNLLLNHAGEAGFDQVKYLEKINVSANRMATLIRDLLNFSRLSKANEAFVPTDLNQVLGNVLSDFEMVIKQKNAQVSSTALPVIPAIPIQMNQLFHNLISNALKFSDKTPHIHITAAEAGSEAITAARLDPAKKYIQLSFSDNGIGFDQSFAQQIFVIFQQLNNRQKYSGTGIGLAVCKKIADNHHGSISAISSPGKGATFVLYLPA